MRTSLLLALCCAVAACNADASRDSFSERISDADKRAIGADVSGFVPVQGTRSLMASLHPKRESPSYSRGEYSGGIVLNHLFYDLDSRTSRWLFPDSRQSVLHTLPLTNTDRSYEFRSSSRADTNRVLGLLYLVVGDDTNEDGDLDGEDDFRIAVSSPEGTGYTTLIESAEVFHGAFRVDDAHTLLVWEKDETLRGTEVNLPGRTVTRETPLPSPPESNP